MRTTLTIPDDYYKKLEDQSTTRGYNSVNEYINQIVRIHCAKENKGGPTLSDILTAIEILDQKLSGNTPYRLPEVTTGPLSKGGQASYASQTSPIPKAYCAICGYYKEVSLHKYIDPKSLTQEEGNICKDCVSKARIAGQLKDEEKSGQVLF